MLGKSICRAGDTNWAKSKFLKTKLHEQHKANLFILYTQIHKHHFKRQDDNSSSNNNKNLIYISLLFDYHSSRIHIHTTTTTTT